MVPAQLPTKDVPLETDPRLTGRIKWRIKPIIFGGDPTSEENITWVSHDQHGELTRFWNAQYAQAVGSQLGA